MVNELNAVVRELGGRRTFPRALRSQDELRAAIRKGFPAAAIQGLLEATSLSLEELAVCLDLSVRSLQRRRRSGRLMQYESDRLYRLARIVALAEQSLGDRGRGIRWLKKANATLGGAAPMEVLDTEIGARRVEDALGRIAYGGVS